MSKKFKYNYFPNTNNDEFRLYKECQNLAADILVASASARKEYRFTICKKIHDMSCDLIHMVNLANAYRLGSDDRKEAQQEIVHLILRIEELMPVLTRCRCISPKQEIVIVKSIGKIKTTYEFWMESDKKRIKQLPK
ncbi:MAG: hypothetical protein IJ958_01135 [Agathobacter sp.]|nr:hypothetical protein [Agathobacter sp.]